MEAQCYFIRHLKKGILTDRVYLQKPTNDFLIKLFGEADVKNKLVRIVPTVVASDNKEHSDLFAKLDKIEASTTAQVKTDKVFKIVASGVGIVSNPKK